MRQAPVAAPITASKAQNHVIHTSRWSLRSLSPQITASPRSQIKCSTGAGGFDETPALREAVTTYQQASKMAAAQTRHDLLQAESCLEPTATNEQAAGPSSREALEAFWLEMGLAARASSRLTQQLLSDYHHALPNASNHSSSPHPGTPATSGSTGFASASQPISDLHHPPPQPIESAPTLPFIHSPSPNHNTQAKSSTPTTESVDIITNTPSRSHHPPSVSRLSTLVQRWQRVLPGADIASLAATDPRFLDCDPSRAINNVVTIIACLPGVEPLSVIAAHVPILWATDLQDRILRIAHRLVDLHPSHDMKVVCEILAETPGLLWRLDYYPHARLLDELPMEVQNAMVLGDSGLGFLYRHYASKSEKSR